ncbi:hypothetical protein QTP88_010513 [Uroleucon formosanum]
MQNMTNLTAEIFSHTYNFTEQKPMIFSSAFWEVTRGNRQFLLVLLYKMTMGINHQNLRWSMENDQLLYILGMSNTRLIFVWPSAANINGKNIYLFLIILFVSRLINKLYRQFATRVPLPLFTSLRLVVR